jgi:hypothetical protein
MLGKRIEQAVPPESCCAAACTEQGGREDSNGVALGLFAWQTSRGNRVVDHAVVVLIAANAVLSLTE